MLSIEAVELVGPALDPLVPLHSEECTLLELHLQVFQPTFLERAFAIYRGHIGELQCKFAR